MILFFASLLWCEYNKNISMKITSISKLAFIIIIIKSVCIQNSFLKQNNILQYVGLEYIEIFNLYACKLYFSKRVYIHESNANPWLRCCLFFLTLLLSRSGYLLIQRLWWFFFLKACDYSEIDIKHLMFQTCYFKIQSFNSCKKFNLSVNIFYFKN
jgi:hypothetical protein